MKSILVILLCIGCFYLGIYAGSPPVVQEMHILKILNIDDGVLVDPDIYQSTREAVFGDYILTIEDFEFVTGIRIKGTGEVIEFDDDYWTEILSEVYFFSE